jgi:hypothetical protein
MTQAEALWNKLYMQQTAAHFAAVEGEKIF